jgi:hypothetical protein
LAAEETLSEELLPLQQLKQLRSRPVARLVVTTATLAPTTLLQMASLEVDLEVSVARAAEERAAVDSANLVVAPVRNWAVVLVSWAAVSLFFLSHEFHSLHELQIACW